MTDDDYAPVAARAERLGIPTSLALRQLVAYGAMLDAGETNGFVITPRARSLIADGLPTNVRFGAGLDPAELDHLETETGLPDGARAHLQAGATLIFAPEDFNS